MYVLSTQIVITNLHLQSQIIKIKRKQIQLTKADRQWSKEDNDQETYLRYHPDYNFDIRVKKLVCKPNEMHNQWTVIQVIGQHISLPRRAISIVTTLRPKIFLPLTLIRTIHNRVELCKIIPGYSPRLHICNPNIKHLGCILNWRSHRAKQERPQYKPIQRPLNPRVPRPGLPHRRCNISRLRNTAAAAAAIERTWIQNSPPRIPTILGPTVFRDGHRAQIQVLDEQLHHLS